MIKTSLILAASLLAVIPAPAFATTETIVVRTVRYADLNLNSPAGRRQLDRRIDAAVRAVCSAALPSDLRSSVEVQQCRIHTRATAIYPPALAEQIAGDHGTN
jgi:UrcA family protein